MQAFGQYLWPPEQAGQSGGVDSDNEDAQNVEHLVNPYEHQVHNTNDSGFLFVNRDNISRPPTALEYAMATTTTSTPPLITLNNVPVSSQPLREVLAQSQRNSPTAMAVDIDPATPLPNGNDVSPSSFDSARHRTPSPRGSKRNTPRQSPERTIQNEHAHTHAQQGHAKIRLVTVPDLQKETLMEDLKKHLALSTGLLEKFGKDLQTMKESTSTTKRLAEKAEQRALAAEQMLEKERLQTQLQLQKIQTDIQAELSKHMHEADMRAETWVKSIKNMEQATRPQSAEAHDDQQNQQMAVDDVMQPRSDRDRTLNKGKQRNVETNMTMTSQTQPSRSLIPPLPRFPQSVSKADANANAGVTSSSIPKPLNFNRPKSSGKPIAIPSLKRTTFLCAGDSDSDGDDSDGSGSDEDGRKYEQKPKPNISNLNGEEMLKLLLKSIGGIQTGNIGSVPAPGRRRAHPDFKQPSRKMPKERGTQDLMNWLRSHLHLLLNIKRSRDILALTAEVYSSNTPAQRHMEHWEKTKEGEAPKVSPIMQVNWNNFDGPWNTHLCELFVRHCADQGLEEANSNDEVKEFIAGYFWDRLVRLRRILRKNKPKQNETVQETSARAAGQHLLDLITARRNSRRNQKHRDRIDICLENLPEKVTDITTDEQLDWKRRYDVVMALGPEGMSSDETDESDPDTYWVRRLPWRNRKAMHILIAVDDAKNTTNAYGNIRSGNRPRTRQRRKNAVDSARKVPLGKPKSIYEPEWYGGLNAGKKRALKVKPDIPFE